MGGVWPMVGSSAGCAAARTSVTAGTIFDRTRTPLTVWFAACWLFVSRKNGVSALGLQKTLGIGSYQTAWAMLHRIRSALVRPERERLSGRVEVDETLIGGHAEGDLGGRPWVRRYSSASPWRCCHQRVWALPDERDPNATGPALRQFLVDNIVEGSTVVTDGFKSYWLATKGRYVHERHGLPASPDPRLSRHPPPGALVKRWLLGTHHSTMDEAHPAYLNEFVFRFNRRRSRSRGMLLYRLLDARSATTRSATATSSQSAARNSRPARRRSRPDASHPA